MNRPDVSRRAHLLGTLAFAALLATACGGGDPTDTVREQPQGKDVTITSLGANVVSQWNEIAFATASVAASVAGATPSERVPGPDVTTVQLAVYDAVIAIAGTHQPYAVRPTTQGVGAGPVAMQAAAIEAAYQVLKGLFPSRGALYETAHTGGLAAIAASNAKTLGIAIGAEVASGMLALRANDGRERVLPAYVPGTLPGQYRNSVAVNRIAPYIKPFATLNHAQFRAPGPLALNSEDYATDFNEVKAMGSLGSSQRSAMQTVAARFHTEPPNPFWARNLRQFATANDSLADNARVLAMLWTAYQDAIGACFESKYYYYFWRPTSAIALADTDGNAATAAEAGWVPVLPTPPHPEYPAAHGCVSGAIAEVLRDFYATKKVSFSFNSNASSTTSPYERTDDLTKEVIDARVWGGMHFRSSGEHGVDLGKRVTKWITKHYFNPL